MKFSSKAQKTAEKSTLEEDLDYRDKKMSVHLENQDALDISLQKREGCGTWLMERAVVANTLVTQIKD